MLPTSFIAIHLEDLLSPRWTMLASAVGWVVFSVYWEIAKKNAAPAASSESPRSRSLHVSLANTALFLIFLPIPGLKQRFLPLSPAVIAFGFFVEATGLLLAIWARRHLGRNWSGEITIKVDHALIRTGPYRRIRHPIYTAVLGMYAGSAVVSGELHALLGLILAVLAYWRKIRLEEQNLTRAFGEDYQNYLRETWALIPGVY